MLTSSGAQQTHLALHERPEPIKEIKRMNDEKQMLTIQ
jgi:hypothetical protein